MDATLFVVSDHGFPRVSSKLNDTDAADSTSRCKRQLASAQCSSKVHRGIMQISKIIEMVARLDACSHEAACMPQHTTLELAHVHVYWNLAC